MSPEQPVITPPNLDFILQTSTPKPKRFGRKSKSQRIMLVVVTGIVLIVVAVLLFSTLQARGKRGSAELIDLAAYQTEFARITEIGVKNGTTTNIRSTAQTSRLTIMSDLGRTKNMINSLGVELVESDLSKYKTESIDTELEAAKTSNNFDDEYARLFEEKLTDYEAKLADTFLAQNNTKIKNTLSTFNSHAVMLSANFQAGQ